MTEMETQPGLDGEQFIAIGWGNVMIPDRLDFGKYLIASWRSEYTTQCG